MTFSVRKLSLIRTIFLTLGFIHLGCMPAGQMKFGQKSVDGDGNQEIFQITIGDATSNTSAAVSSSAVASSNFDGSKFKTSFLSFESANKSGKKTRSYVWFNVQGAGQDPALDTRVANKLEFLSTATAEQVALKISEVLQKNPDYSVKLVGNVITVTNIARYDVEDVAVPKTDAQIKVVVLQQGGKGSGSGSGSTDTSNSPLVSGTNYSCYLFQGIVKCWGDNQFGQLGDTTPGTYSSTPVTVRRKDNGEILTGVKRIVAGNGYQPQGVSVPTSDHTCAILDNSKVYCWGDGGYGQLGNGAQGFGYKEYRAVEATEFSGLNIKMLALGSMFSCALTTDGKVYCLGMSSVLGILGPKVTSVAESKKVEIPGISSDADVIYAGTWHVCVLLKSGKIQCWGFNAGKQNESDPNAIQGYGVLGNEALGKTLSSAVPVYVDAPSGLSGVSIESVQSLRSGYFGNCLIYDGRVMCWGPNAVGKLGSGLTDGILASSYKPILATIDGGFGQSFADKPVNDVNHYALGPGHVCVAHKGGGMHCWGGNDHGQLGNAGVNTPCSNYSQYSTVSCKPAAVEVTAMRSTLVSYVSAGLAHTCAVLAANDKVYCWGGNAYGQIGNSLVPDGGVTSNLPVEVNIAQAVAPPSLPPGVSTTPVPLATPTPTPVPATPTPTPTPVPATPTPTPVPATPTPTPTPVPATPTPTPTPVPATPTPTPTPVPATPTPTPTPVPATPTPTPTPTPVPLGIRNFTAVSGADPKGSHFYSTVTGGDVSNNNITGSIEISAGAKNASGVAALTLTKDQIIGFNTIDSNLVCIKITAAGSSGKLDCNGGQVAVGVSISQNSNGTGAQSPETVLFEQGNPATSPAGSAYISAYSIGVICPGPNCGTLALPLNPTHCNSAQINWAASTVSGTAYLTTGSQTTTVTNARLMSGGTGTITISKTGNPFSCNNWSTDNNARLLLGAPTYDTAFGDLANILQLGFTP